MVPVSPSLTMPRCLAYQVRRASGFSDLKKNPPIPRTRAMGVCYAAVSIKSTREKAPKVDLRQSPDNARLLRFELRWVLHVCSILRREGISRLLVGARKFLRMMDVVKEEDAHIKRCSGKLPTSCRVGRDARGARRRAELEKLHGRPDS